MQKVGDERPPEVAHGVTSHVPAPRPVLRMRRAPSSRRVDRWPSLGDVVGSVAHSVSEHGLSPGALTSAGRELASDAVRQSPVAGLVPHDLPDLGDVPTSPEAAMDALTEHAPGLLGDAARAAGLPAMPDISGLTRQATQAVEGAMAPVSQAATAAGPGGAGHDLDEMYEHMIDRLRRDLLDERERMGDLVGDL